MQIALGAVLVLALVWFVALKPKSEDTATTQPTPTTGITDRPNEAQSAVNSANAKNGAAEQQAEQTGSDTQSGGTAAAPKTGSQSASKAESEVQKQATPKSTVKSTDPSAAIINSAKKGNVEVVLFWDPAGSDDRHVRQAVQQINTREGTVKVHAYEISEVGKYTALTQDVAVNVSPTLIILSPKLDAWRITGYTDTAEINGLVGAIARRSEK